MRVLLAATASYAPPRGGATRSNLLWLDHLARAGHECRVIAGAAGEGAELRPHPSIEIHALAEPARRADLLRKMAREWGPDWVLISSEDLGHSLLREAARSAAGRVVYLAHTPQFFPFGPESWNREADAAAMVANAAGIVAIGQKMSGYIESSLGVKAEVIHPPIYGAGPFPRYDKFARGRVLMINPCAVKGIDIFVRAARALPGVEFGAVPGWGTTAADRRMLAEANVAIVPNAAAIDDILAETRILLMPSLWFEGFGLIVMETMLRGIPVIASDSGGLAEAKLGTGYVIPTRPIARYLAEFDEQAMPRPEIPENDVGPWVAAIEELLRDREAYAREAEVSREGALKFVAKLDGGEMERFLMGLRPRADAPARAAGIEALSPERRALLLERLRKSKSGGPR